MTDFTSLDRPVRFEGQFHVGPDYARRAARGFFTFSLTRPRSWISLVLLVVGLALITLPSGANAWIVLVAAVVAAVVTLLIQRSRMLKRFEVIAPTGSEYSIELFDDVLNLSSPLGSSQTLYVAYEAISSRSDLVFLKQRTARIYLVLPVELFTPESLAYLREKIGQPTKS